MATGTAPGRTFTNILAEPAINLQTGCLEPWLGQFLLRLTGYVGPVPAAGSSKTTNLTLTQQIAAAAAIAAAANAPLPAPAQPAPPGPKLPLITGQTILQSGAVISDGFLGVPTGPNGLVAGNIGDVFLQRDGTLATGAVWMKMSGQGTTSGWLAVPGDTDLNVTATGTNFATSYPIYRQKTIFTTVAANTGGALPVPIPGLSLRVLNRGANPLLLWPGAGIQIETRGAGNSATVPVNGAMNLDGESTTLWAAS